MTEQSNLQYAQKLFVGQSINIQFKDSTVFVVDTAIIALEYAHYYSKVDGITVKECLDIARSEYESSNETLVDWLQNNMDWSSVEQFAFIVHQKPPRQYSDMFKSGDWSVL